MKNCAARYVHHTRIFSLSRTTWSATIERKAGSFGLFRAKQASIAWWLSFSGTAYFGTLFQTSFSHFHKKSGSAAHFLTELALVELSMWWKSVHRQFKVSFLIVPKLHFGGLLPLSLVSKRLTRFSRYPSYNSCSSFRNWHPRTVFCTRGSLSPMVTWLLNGIRLA